jgi:hypothetical protein
MTIREQKYQDNECDCCGGPLSAFGEQICPDAYGGSGPRSIIKELDKFQLTQQNMTRQVVVALHLTELLLKLVKTIGHMPAPSIITAITIEPGHTDDNHCTADIYYLDLSKTGM